MPVYQLSPRLIFPPARDAGTDGLLAIGGDLSPRRLLLAYSSGIFPWFSEGDPILWWSPDPRAVIMVEDVTAGRSMRKVLRNGGYTLRVDTAFAEVIRQCALIRDSTWITAEMMQAYISLHSIGYAHSFETWLDGHLVGGLYGISLGRAFFGESMFALARNASKAAFYGLAAFARQNEFLFIDSQIQNEHMATLGSHEVSRSEFLVLLEQALAFDTLSGHWSDQAGDLTALAVETFARSAR